MPKPKLTAGKIIKCDRFHDGDDVRQRLADRDAWQAANPDTRTDVQRWLGDPPPGRSALAGYIAKLR